MVFSFNEYIKESGTGAISMDMSPVSRLNQPDVKSRISPINMGRGGPGRGHSLPYHWGSTALSFGSNPKKNKKGMAKNRVDSFDKFTKKQDKEKELSEQAQDVTLNVPQQFQAENDAIIALKDQIAKQEQEIAAKKVDLNNKIKELQNKIAGEQAKVANVTNQPTTQATPPTSTGTNSVI